MKSFIFVIFTTIYLCNAENIPGVVQLNTGTFDKVIQRFEAVLVKFDETYPYGDAQDAYKQVVADSLSQDNLLMAELHVADYGEKDNQELALRFALSKDDFPAYKLFIKGKEQPVTYSGDIKNADALKRFIMKESGLWLGLPACIEEFDELVKRFWKSDEKTRQVILQEAQNAAEKREDATEKERADIYVKYLVKILEKGDDFIEGELTRVEKLSQSKVTDKKKEQLRDRASILTSFQLRLKDEL